MNPSRFLPQSPQPFREITPPSPPTPILKPRTQHRDIGFGSIFFEHALVDPDTNKRVIYQTFVPKNGYCPGCPGRAGAIIAAPTQHAGPYYREESAREKFWEEERVANVKAELDRLARLKAEEDKMRKEIEEHVRLAKQAEEMKRENPFSGMFGCNGQTAKQS